MSPRLTIFISGNGTNLQAVLDAVDHHEIDAEVALVVSNRKAAYGLVRAQQAGVPTLYFPLKPYNDTGLSREIYDRDLAERVSAYKPDLIVLAGWMHIFNAVFLDYFPKRVINLHPALPGQFPGTDSIRRAFEAYQHGKIDAGGCMVHYVVPEVDAGPIIAQAAVPILPLDTLETFEQRLHEAERHLLVKAIATVLSTLTEVERNINENYGDT